MLDLQARSAATRNHGVVSKNLQLSDIIIIRCSKILVQSESYEPRLRLKKTLIRVTSKLGHRNSSEYNYFS